MYCTASIMRSAAGSPVNSVVDATMLSRDISRPLAANQRWRGSQFRNRSGSSSASFVIVLVPSGIIAGRLEDEPIEAVARKREEIRQLTYARKLNAAS